MNYEIHIRDTENEQDPLILHYAERNSISLNWLGGDDKTQPIVGSELNFTLEVLDGEDGKYDQYFTSNETKWEVTKVISTTQEVIWRGYLLPESYSEPYAYPAFYVNFSATDGLGLLKGKKLTSDFYSDEKKVIDVICAALKLTALDFDVYLAPAIRNQLNKKWHQVFLDTQKYYDEDTLPSAYELLEEIIFSMRCQLFQADERWYIEGINKRQFINLDYDKYSINGNFIGVVNHTKNVKVLDFAPTPNITMVPPYKEVVVTHEAAQLEVSQDVYQESSTDWKISEYALHNFYLARYWNFFQSGYKAVIVQPNSSLLLQNINQASSLDLNRYINLKTKLYVLKGWRVKITLEFELKLTEEITDPSPSLIESWVDIVGYYISLGSDLLYTNRTDETNTVERLVFDESKKAELEFIFNAPENGALDVGLYEPFGDISTTKVSGVFLSNLEVENVNQVDDYVAVTTIDGNASSTKEFELPISDDVSGFSKCFYLEPTRQLTAFNALYEEVEVLDIITHQGEKYYVVSLLGAVLIDEYRNYLKYDTTNIPDYFAYTALDVEVFYNWLGGELMVVKADLNGFTPLKFRVEVRKIKYPTIDRGEWLKWTDDIYQVEEKPYAQVVAEIEKKLYEKQHLRIEGDCHSPVKFNDVIKFKWQGEEKYFSPTNCGWNVDDSISSIILVENIYAGLAFGNLPPFVTTGETLYLSPVSNQTTIGTVGQNAFDPDGTIASLTWQKLAGGPVSGIAQQSNTASVFYGLTGDYYKFRLTAVDNAGATSFDDLEIFRNLNFLLDTEVINDIETGSSFNKNIIKTYRLKLNPDLPEDTVITFSYDLNLGIFKGMFVDDIYASVYVVKESNSFFYGINKSDLLQDSAYLSIESESITLTKEDYADVTFSCKVENAQSLAAFARARMIFTNYEFNAGQGTVSNIPLTLDVVADLV